MMLVVGRCSCFCHGVKLSLLALVNFNAKTWIIYTRVRTIWTLFSLARMVVCFFLVQYVEKNVKFRSGLVEFTIYCISFLFVFFPLLFSACMYPTLFLLQGKMFTNFTPFLYIYTSLSNFAWLTRLLQQQWKYNS